MSGPFWGFRDDYLAMSEINRLLDDVSDEAKEPSLTTPVEVQDEILKIPLEQMEKDKDIQILDKLLDQQEILQELMSSNTKLIDFLKGFKCLNRLVELVILEYPEYIRLKANQRVSVIDDDDSVSVHSGDNQKESGDSDDKSKEDEEKSKDDDGNEKMDLDPKEDQVSETSSDDSTVKSDASKWDDNSLSSFLDSNSYYHLDENREDHDEDVPDGPEEIYSRRSQLAAEIMSSDIWSITNSFINYPRLLCKLWSILDTKKPISMMKSTFFSKINEHLLDMKTDELVSHILNFEKDLTQKFLNHVTNPQLMDFLLKLLSTDKPVDSTGIILFLKRQNFIPSLIDFLKPEYPNAVQTSAGDFLKAFIAISGNSASGQDGNGGAIDSSLIGPNELTRQLVSKKVVKKLVKNMLCGGNSLSNGVGIVIEIIRKNNSDYDSLQVLYVTTETHPPSLRDPIYLGHLVKVFSRNLKKFKRMLLLGSDLNPLTNFRKEITATSFGKRIEPLGFERFKLCELIAELLHCSNMTLLNEAAGEDAVKERDTERSKVLKAEYEKLDENRANFVEDLRESGDLVLSEYLEKLGEDDCPSISVNNWTELITESQSEESALSPDSNNAQEIVHNINRLSINDEEKDSESVASIRSEHNKNKRAKIDKAFGNQSGGVYQSESDDESDDVLVDDSDDTSADDESLSDTDTVYEINFEESDDDLTSEKFSFDFKDLISKHSYRNEFHVKNRKYYDAEEVKTRERFLIGDQLKIALQDSNIVLIIVDFFFKFPWNNFLHNVVYDIIQQILNGSVDVGFNKYLIINLFLKEKGFILEKILRGYEFSEKYEKANNSLRLGYMGHLTLISEEIVKFLNFSNLRNLFWEPVEGQESDREYEFVNDGEEWNQYVNVTLTEIREQFNSVLGGGTLADEYEVITDSSSSIDKKDDDNDNEEEGDGNKDEDEEDDDDEEDDENEDENKDDDDFSSGNRDIGSGSVPDEANENDNESYDNSIDKKDGGVSKFANKNNSSADGDDEPIEEEEDSYKWYYLDKSEYKTTNTSSQDVNLEEDEYIDPNDDGNNYANDKNRDIYHISSDKKKKAMNSVEDDGEELEVDDDDVDIEDEDEEEDYGLKRSKVKGDMNWDEDEQKRLLTMANYIHNNTGGSAVEH